MARRLFLPHPVSVQPPLGGRTPGSPPGIALLIVMVVFVLLYLVVYQFTYRTTMEASLGTTRAMQAEAAGSMYSAGLFVIAHLIEDLQQGASGGETGAASASGLGGGLGGGTGGSPAGGPGGSRGGGGPGAGAEGLLGTMMPIQQETGGAGSGQNYDYLNKNIFNPNQQQIGSTTLKYTVRDGERSFSLEHLFDYVRLKDEEVSPDMANLSEEELAGLVAGKSEEEGAQSLRDQFLKTSRAQQSRERLTGADEAGGEGLAGARGAGGEDPATSVTNDYDPEEWIPPSPERVEATEKMLERTLIMMFSINENKFGYRYAQRYDAATMARDIVQYVLDRKQSQFLSHIYLVTELLNIPGITSEVFYGPTPRVLPGEEVQAGDGFVLHLDEFGDIIPQWLYGEDPSMLEDERETLKVLEDQYGRFSDLPNMGLGRLAANPLTRGMNELPIDVDENGEEFVVEAPVAIGLKDIFTTFSSGRININTAPIPVIFGLLTSLTEEEADFVASQIGDYRRRFQEEQPEEGGVSNVASGKEAPDLGQPRRKPKSEDQTSPTSQSAANANLASAAAGLGIDPTLAGSLESTYQELETNYFTKLEQLELVDGTDEGPNDRLTSKDGIQKVDVEDDSLLRRTLHDLEKVATFGSTYFNVEIKARPQNSQTVNTGYLTVRRDVKAHKVEVLLWKNQAR